MEKEEVVFTERGRSLTASIVCELDHHSAKRVREKIDGELFLKKPEVLILDFSSVRFMDSSGIALIIGRAECAGVVGARVHLCGLCPSLMKLVGLSGIEKIKNLTVSRG